MNNQMDYNVRKWWVLFTMCLLTVMLNFDATAVNLAIPVIAQEFHESLVNMQWVINAFVLFAAMFQIVGGRAGDLYGHRKVFVIGTVIFVIASCVASLSTNGLLLILARVGQGFALGISYPMTLALVYHAFPRKQHGLAMGFIMGAMGLSLAMGPTLGGVILEYIGWRWIFWVNVPVGVITILFTYIFCRPDDKQNVGKSIDYGGAVILLLALFGFVYSLNQSQQWGVGSLRFILIMAIALLLFVLLYFVERHKKDPTVDFSLFKQRNYLLHNWIRLVAQVVFVPILFFIPVYLQNIGGFPALFSGLVMLWLTVVVAILSPIAGKIVDWFGVKWPTAIAMLAYLLGCIAFYQLKAKPDFTFLVCALMLVGIGTGISFVSTTVGALSAVPIKKSGVASGIYMTTAWVSAAIGIAIMGVTLAGRSQAWLLKYIGQQEVSLTHLQVQTLIRASRGMLPLNSHEYFNKMHISPQLVKLASHAFMHGFHAAILVLMGFSLISLVVTFLLVREK